MKLVRLDNTDILTTSGGGGPTTPVSDYLIFGRLGDGTPKNATLKGNYDGTDLDFDATLYDSFRYYLEFEVDRPDFIELPILHPAFTDFTLSLEKIFDDELYSDYSDNTQFVGTYIYDTLKNVFVRQAPQ